MVFEDSSGTIETCVNPKCTLYGDVNYYPSAGGPVVHIFLLVDRLGKAV